MGCMGEGPGDSILFYTPRNASVPYLSLNVFFISDGCRTVGGFQFAQRASTAGSTSAFPAGPSRSSTSPPMCMVCGWTTILRLVTQASFIVGRLPTWQIFEGWNRTTSGHRKLNHSFSSQAGPSCICSCGSVAFFRFWVCMQTS